MHRIIELMDFYREKGFTELVEKFGAILRSGDNAQAEETAKAALLLLQEVAIRKDHISKLKAFLFDLVNNQIKIQPLL